MATVPIGLRIYSLKPTFVALQLFKAQTWQPFQGFPFEMGNVLPICRLKLPLEETQRLWGDQCHRVLACTKVSAAQLFTGLDLGKCSLCWDLARWGELKRVSVFGRTSYIGASYRQKPKPFQRGKHCLKSQMTASTSHSYMAKYVQMMLSITRYTIIHKIISTKLHTHTQIVLPYTWYLARWIGQHLSKPFGQQLW